MLTNKKRYYKTLGTILIIHSLTNMYFIAWQVRVTEKLAASGQFQVAEHRTLTASTEITIVEDLYSKTPDTCCSNHLLVAPGSTLQLNTNRFVNFDFQNKDTFCILISFMI